MGARAQVSRTEKERRVLQSVIVSSKGGVSVNSWRMSAPIPGAELTKREARKGARGFGYSAERVRRYGSGGAGTMAETWRA